LCRWHAIPRASVFLDKAPRSDSRQDGSRPLAHRSTAKAGTMHVSRVRQPGPLRAGDVERKRKAGKELANTPDALQRGSSNRSRVRGVQWETAPILLDVQEDSESRRQEATARAQADSIRADLLALVWVYRNTRGTVLAERLRARMLIVEIEVNELAAVGCPVMWQLARDLWSDLSNQWHDEQSGNIGSE
jgi:hypothetical protein